MSFTREIKKAILKTEKMFDKKNLNEFIQHNYEKLYTYHFSIGIKIRNEILTTDSKLYNLFLKCGVTHKDDMSSLLIRLFYIYIKSKSLE